jgi:hypothetical protein
MKLSRYADRNCVYRGVFQQSLIIVISGLDMKQVRHFVQTVNADVGQGCDFRTFKISQRRQMASFSYTPASHDTHSYDSVGH